jgi:AcrR family transcriptional regulator
MTAANETDNLRNAHRDLTRGRIVEAALDLLREGKPDGLTFAAVAARAGMTERTVYRHFETREALMAAAWTRIADLVKTPEMPRTPDAAIAQPRTAFPAFDAQERLMRMLVLSFEGHAIRLGVNEARTAAFRAAVKLARPDLKEPEFTRLCAAVQLLDSSFAWLMMKDYWGLSGHDAGRAASDAIATLLASPAPEPKHKPRKKEKRK